MKRYDVKIGRTYGVQINGVMCAVKIIQGLMDGVLVGVDLRNGKEIKLSSTRRVIKELCPGAIAALSK